MAPIDLRIRRRSHPKLKILGTGAAVCALVLSVSGYTVALAAGHGGHGASHTSDGTARSAAKAGFASSARPAPRLSVHGRIRIGVSGSFLGDPEPYSPYAAAPGTTHETDFANPSSLAYVPYCDPGSLYYDPSSCDDVTR